MRKKIKKVSSVPIEPLKGNIVDTTNIDDKTTNTYSANVIDKFNTYSTEEYFTGKYWHDGKKIYGKVFNNLGALPNAAGRKTYNWNIANINELITYDIKAIYSDGAKLTIPYLYPDIAYISKWITTEFITTAGVEIVVGEDRSYFHLKAILEYTKTTD